MSFVLPAVRRLRLDLLAGIFAVLLFAVSNGHAQTPVRFLFDWKIDGTVTPFLLAIDKGHFKAEGLDVSVAEPAAADRSDSEQEALKRIAAGEFEMGYADINAMVRFRDQNPQAAIKAVYIVHNKAAYSVVGRKSRGVTYPKDLEGKKVGAPPRDLSFSQWKAFVQANALDESKIALENIGMPVREPMLAAGQVDAVTGLSFTSYINLKDRGVPADDIAVMPMADYGVNLYGNAIVVNAKFAEENPEVVKAFLRAFTKGLKDSLSKASSSIESVVKRNETLRKDLELERFKMAIRDNILTPEVKQNGYGAADPERLSNSIALIAIDYTFKQKPDPGTIFDASFLPSAALRKAN